MTVVEISISNQLKQAIDDLATRYATDGLWLARLYVKRWDFIYGSAARGVKMPQRFNIDARFALFAEEGEALAEQWDIEREKLKAMLP